jgi:erythronate-4-phosphate dehydrogenase
MKLVIDTDIPYIKGVFEPFCNEVIYKKGNEISSKDLFNADALIIRTRTICNETLLAQSKVKAIATATIGTDHINTNYCKSKGIQVFSAPGCNRGGVLQWVLAAMVGLYNDEDIELKGKVLGVVGVGNIGSLVAMAAQSLGITVLQCDPPRARAEGGNQFTNLKTIATESDIISFHVPLTFHGVDSTHYLADQTFFNLLKPNARIINSARGGVINEDALVRAMAAKNIKAAIDVWENEPIISASLLNKCTIGTPHIAGYSLEGKVNATVAVVKAISNFFNLGLKNWYPSPDPLKEKIRIDIAKFITNQRINYMKLLHSIYPIRHDDESLRLNPAHFEQIRSEYSFRRENSGYIVSLQKNEFEIDQQILQGLGLITDYP